MRYFIKLAYNGNNYHGWQIQPNAISVQETLQNVLAILLKTTPQKLNLMGAGRTDTGVHAKEMYAHFDVDELINISILIYKLNSFLPKSIVVYDVFKVKNNAHCRFDALKRTYNYHINLVKNPFLENQSWYFNKPLNVNLMNEASQVLLKYKNFESFSKVNTDVANFDCIIFEAYWQQKNDKLIFVISANRFLRNMVRAIVGTLIEVGLKKINLNDFKTIIESKSRKKAGFSAPAHGLYLTKIEYENLKD